MTRFQFSLQGLLDLRRRELQRLEAMAAEAAAHAASLRRRQLQLLESLRADAQWHDAQQWLLFQQGAAMTQRLAAEAGEQADAHHRRAQQLLQERAAKNTEVEALQTLRDEQLSEHLRTQRRRDERRQSELILRQWSAPDSQQTGAHNG